MLGAPLAFTAAMPRQRNPNRLDGLAYTRSASANRSSMNSCFLICTAKYVARR